MTAFHEALEEFMDEKITKKEAVFRAKTERLTLLQNKAELLSAFVRADPDFVEYIKSAMNGEQDLVLAETIFGRHLVDDQIRGDSVCPEQALIDCHWFLVLVISKDCSCVQLGIRSDTPCDPSNIPDPVWESFLPVLQKFKGPRSVFRFLFEKYPPVDC